MKSGIPAVCKVNSTLEAVSFFFQINAVRKNITEALETYVNFPTGTVGPQPLKWRRHEIWVTESTFWALLEVHITNLVILCSGLFEKNYAISRQRRIKR